MKFTKKLFQIIHSLNSDLSPSKIALSSALGIFWGMTPILSPHNFLILFLVIILKIPISFALLSMALSLPFSFFFVDSINTLGSSILENAALTEMFTSFYNSFLIISKFNNTFIMGSLTISLALFLPVFIILRWMVKKYQESFRDFFLSSFIYKKILKKTIIFDLFFNIQAEEELSGIPSSKKSGVANWVDWKFVIPILLVLIVGGVGVKYFLDDTIKDLIAKYATEYNQALVELSRFNSTLSEAKVSVYDFEWTDNKNPMNNLFQFESFSADAETLPLLRGRFVFDQLSVVNLELNRPRSKSGQLPGSKSPALPPVPTNNQNNQIATIFSRFSSTSENNDQADEKSGAVEFFQEQLDKMLEESKKEAESQGDELIRKNRELIAKYEKQIKELEDSYNFQKEIDQFKSINFNQIKDLPTALNVAQNIGGIDQSIKKTKESIQKVNTLKQSFTRDFRQLQSSMNINNIKNNLEKRLLKIFGLNSISLEGFSEKIFSPILAYYLEPFVEQYEQYKELLVEKRDEIEATPVTYDPSIRGGRNIDFPVKTPFPRFYIKKVLGTGNPDLDGVYKLDIDNLSSDPEFAPIHHAISLKHEIFKVDLEGELSIKNKKVNVVQAINTHPFPVAEVLELSPNVLFESVREGTGEVRGKLVDNNQVITLSLQLIIKDIAFNLNPSLHSEIKLLLEKSLNAIDVLSLDVKIRRYPDKRYILQVGSNLDRLLKVNVAKFFRDYTAEKRKQALNQLNKAVNPTLAKVNRELRGNTGKDLFKDFDGQISSVSKNIKTLQKKINDLEKQEKNKLLNQVEKVIPKELKSLPKKIKLPF